MISFIFRLGLLFFSVWQETVRWPDGQLRFTDVDYDVFSDAAAALVLGRDIYTVRPTYRYSPFIAGLLAPAHWLFPSLQPLLIEAKLQHPIEQKGINASERNRVISNIWGKLLFIVFDLLCAYLQKEMIVTEEKVRIFFFLYLFQLIPISSSY
ncbi:unnamed protein product [Protopolystoma xenopodis]|uniref:GPI alpha-1,4-mannosyltransferase I, catalytic subunit n=1 Tax=Protopolystoma xenopodis TaxID=117903 RepID=A0A3S4ZNP6_9PLAT|nr:unnamed protein product [Protopolystoma xenopodis]